MISFDDIKLSKQIRMALDEAGFEKPTEIQHQVFSPVRSGKDIIGIAQTGTGKTLAYLMPILMKLNFAKGMDPRALIVVPTRELVLQVCETIELLTPYMDIRTLGIYGGVNINTQKEKVYDGVDILVATPGRLMDIYMTRVLKMSQVRTLVIDEADKMMDLGFMPQLNAIFDILPEKHQNLLFSATFSDTVAKMSDDFLFLPERIEVAPQATTVKNIHQIQYRVPNILSKVNLLKHLLEDKEEFNKVMVFTETKKNADRIVDRLEEILGEELSVIHSNKAQNTRINALNAFKEGRARVMVSSDVAARGIDIEDVSHVINFDIPTNYVEYVHRVGRTGRAEKEGTAISFVNEGEEELMEKIEELIRKPVSLESVPLDVEITSQLLEDEKKQTRNIKVKNTIRRDTGAFHQKKAKNMKTPSGSKGRQKQLEAQKRNKKKRRK
ncbi:DEAD/DEAH box helicase [Marinifilum flexuosum]|uniref:ATP-dependent RNA helicase RhlE n=1 Tax=Marinifilum flexuosum TaxID=1117708 RepID=A0A419X9S5_9BACT|nr:DEAD/DEAH box helicase [Marinifilum flexuosum]RKE04491.1 ATP-dependent RNA helicase RhlE [Marinifilum flexuosum]